MRLFTLGLVTGSLLFISVLGACTAQGSSTVVQGPGGTSGAPAPVFPGADGTTDGGSTNPGATDYDALFGPPASTTATPSSLAGLWAGSAGVSSADTRVQFSATSIVVAQKCGSQAVGLSVVAQVTASFIKTLESKTAAPSVSTSDGGKSSGFTCSLMVVPVEVPRCTSTSDLDAQNESASMDGGCFFLSGTKLSFYDETTLIGPAKLTKLSD